MPSYKVFSVLHYIDERPSYWTIIEANPEDRSPEGFQPAGPITGTGLSEENAIADFRARTQIEAGKVTITIIGRDNTNCDTREMLENIA